MEYTNNSNSADISLLPFDPIVLVQDLLKRWLIVLAAALMVGVGAYIYEDYSYEPEYRTTATFVVTTKGSSSTVYNNLTSTKQVASIFTELLNSSILRKTILTELGIGSFDGYVSTAVIPETNLINMTVTASDPRMAFVIAQAIIDYHETLTYEVVGDVVLEVLQAPAVPTAPSNYANAQGRMRQMFILVALATCLLVLFQSLTRNAVRSGREARSKLECTYLGEIPHENKYKTILSRLNRRKTSILISNPLTSFRFTETIRKLRHRVEQYMKGKKVLMVTSLLENEGKSTVAVNLALALSQKHERVLLIDCDLRKPACHAVLEHKKFGNGTKEILTGKANPAECVIRCAGTNMDMLLTRKSDTNSGDLISSERMSSLLNWAREQYDYVVLDLPPMAAASDAEAMSAMADASLIVVRQNAATAPAVNKAVEALDGSEAKLLGCILNNVYSTRISSGTGYGYGKYGHYGSYGSSGKRKGGA